MAYKKHLNNEINHIYERALRVVYNDWNSKFEKFCIKDKTLIFIHYYIFVISNSHGKIDLSPLIIPDIFNFTKNRD